MKRKFMGLVIGMITTLRLLVREGEVLQAANIAEGTYRGGRKTYLTDAAISVRYLIGKLGSDSRHIAVCGASDVPLGVITDEADAAEKPVSVELLGASGDRTVRMVGAAAIAAGDLVTVAAGGKTQTMTGIAAGTYWVIGRALTACSGADAEYEVVPAFPHQATVV